MNTTGTANIDDHSRLFIFHPEVRSSSSDELKGSSVMYQQHRFPLLIGHLYGSIKMRFCQYQYQCYQKRFLFSLSFSWGKKL